MKKFVFGLGTGRCGTKSLAYLLDQQDGVTVHHELAPKLPYIHNEESEVQASEKFRRIKQMSGKIVGDVSLYNLWWYKHIQAILGSKVKFICIMRERGEVIRSFKAKCQKNIGNRKITRNFWSNRKHVELDGQRVRVGRTEWDCAFPNMDFKHVQDGYGVYMSLEESIGAYWDFYHTCVAKMEADVSVVGIGDLNTEEGVNKILDIAGVPKDNKNILTGVQISHHMREVKE